MIKKIEPFCFWEIGRIGINFLDENNFVCGGVDLTTDEATKLAVKLIEYVQNHHTLDLEYHNYAIQDLQSKQDHLTTDNPTMESFFDG